MAKTQIQKTTQTVTSKDGTSIEYDILGQGPPLLIVNGAMSVRDFVFARKMAEGLASKFTVYNYDRRGRGGSGDTKPYAVQREIEDIAALSKTMGGNPCVLGLSSGAALALEAAAAGVPMQGVLAYEPPYVLAQPDYDRAKAAAYQPTLDRLTAEGKRDEAVAYFMRFVGVPGFGVAIMKLLPMWKIMRGVAHTLPYDAQIMNGFEVPAKRFATIKVPVTVAAGEKTTRELKAGAKAAADAIPGSQHRIVPKSNHGVKAAALLPVLLETFAVR